MTTVELDAALAETMDRAVSGRWDRHDLDVNVCLRAVGTGDVRLWIHTSSAMMSLARLCMGEAVALYDAPVDLVMHEQVHGDAMNPDLIVALVPPRDMKRAVDVRIDLRWPDGARSMLCVHMLPAHVSPMTPVVDGAYPYPLVTFRNRHHGPGNVVCTPPRVTTDAAPGVRMLCANLDTCQRRQLALVECISPSSPVVLDLSQPPPWDPALNWVGGVLVLPDLQEALLAEGRASRTKGRHDAIFRELMEAVWAPRRVRLGLIDPFEDDESC